MNIVIYIIKYIILYPLFSALSRTIPYSLASGTFYIIMFYVSDDWLICYVLVDGLCLEGESRKESENALKFDV